MSLAWRLFVRRKIVVNLASGLAVSGILYAQRGPLLILRNATVHEQGAQPSTVDGEIVIERDTVEFIQVMS